MSIVKQVCVLVVTLPQKKVDFTLHLHGGLWVVLRGGFNWTMLSFF